MAKQPIKPATHGTDWLNLCWNAYVALACFVSGVALCVGLIGLGHNAITLAYPKLRYADELLDGYQLNKDISPITNTLSDADKLLLRNGHVAELSAEAWGNICFRKPEDVAAREARLKERTEIAALRDAAEGLVGTLVALLVFGFHWRMFRRKA